MCALFRKITWSQPGNGKLHVRFDPAHFNDDWSGELEACFSTRLARAFLERLQTGS